MCLGLRVVVFHAEHVLLPLLAQLFLLSFESARVPADSQALLKTFHNMSALESSLLCSRRGRCDNKSALAKTQYDFFSDMSIFLSPVLIAGLVGFSSAALVRLIQLRYLTLPTLASYVT